MIYFREKSIKKLGNILFFFLEGLNPAHLLTFLLRPLIPVSPLASPLLKKKRLGVKVGIICIAGYDGIF